MLHKNYRRSRPPGELSSTAKYQSLIAELTQLEETRQKCSYLNASKQILMCQETSQKHKTDTSHPNCPHHQHINNTVCFWPRQKFISTSQDTKYK